MISEWDSLLDPIEATAIDVSFTKWSDRPRTYQEHNPLLIIRDCIAALAPETGRLSFFNIVFSWLFISVFTLVDTISELKSAAESISKG